MLFCSFKNILDSLSLQCSSLAWELGGVGKGMGDSGVRNRREAWRWCKKREEVRKVNQGWMEEQLTQDLGWQKGDQLGMGR